MKITKISFYVLPVSILLALLIGLGTFLISPSASYAQDLIPSKSSVLSGPILMLPESKSSIKDTTPYFKWKILAGAVKFQLVVDDNLNFGTPVVNKTNVTSNYYTLMTPLAEGTYYWRVRAMDAENKWGKWSLIFRFTVDTTAPSVPVLLSPLNGSSTTDHTPTFTWKAVSTATKYVFSIDNNADFSSPVFESPAVEANTYNLLHSIPSGTYYWRVRARDAAANWSAWSSGWKLIIKN